MAKCWGMAAATPVLLLGWLAFAPPAAAASEAQQRRWSGLYIGLNAGYSAADLDWGLEYPFGAPPAHSAFDISDIVTGAHAGVQQQFGRWVLGTEVSLARSLGGDRRTEVHLFTAGLTPSLTGTMHAQIGWMFTATGRIGYVWNDWLLYAKGCYAGAMVSLDTDDRFPPSWVTNSRAFQTGWVAGAGVERMLTNSISLGLDYSYMQLSHRVTTDIVEVGTGPFGFTSTSHIDTAVHSVVGRLSFKLNWDDGR